MYFAHQMLIFLIDGGIIWVLREINIIKKFSDMKVIDGQNKYKTKML